jgi:hypothetical protein
VIYFAERGRPIALCLQRDALPMRVASRRITKPFCSGDRLGEFTTSIQRVTLLFGLLTL